MRLWGWQILPFLPKSQLLSQKRECDLIWNDIANGKQTNHILINYIWEYEDYKKELSLYYYLLKKEFDSRSFKFRICDDAYLLTEYNLSEQPFKNHHNNRYLLQCFYNLQEKYDRGQKDFDDKTFYNLRDGVFGILNEDEEYLA